MTGRINFMTAGINPPRIAAQPTVVAIAARALVDFAVSRGASRQALLDRSGIDGAELVAPHNRVAFDKYVLLMRAAKELCNDPALALHFGESVDINELSIVCQFGALATIDDARTHVNRYGRLIADVETSGDGDRWLMERSGGQLWAIDTRRNPNEFPELTESSFARVICSARRGLGDAMFKEIRVTHEAPSYRAEYARIFRIPVAFSCDRNAVRLDESVLATLRPPQTSRYLQELLRNEADAMVAELDRTKTMRARVEHELLPLLQHGNVSIEAVGKRLGLSRPTLFRRLREEEVTFEQVIDELRHRLAVHYLCTSNASVGQTAHLLGYSDASAFSRAFKRWTGRSPRTISARGRPPQD
jgi:AraC-like DNA-binding protein